MQSGFTGINDIKQHKVLEAKRVFRDDGTSTLAIHIDLYNGQVAFIKLDEIGRRQRELDNQTTNGGADCF